MRRFQALPHLATWAPTRSSQYLDFSCSFFVCVFIKGSHAISQMLFITLCITLCESSGLSQYWLSINCTVPLTVVQFQNCCGSHPAWLQLCWSCRRDRNRSGSRPCQNTVRRGRSSPQSLPKMPPGTRRSTVRKSRTATPRSVCTQARPCRCRRVRLRSTRGKGWRSGLAGAPLCTLLEPEYAGIQPAYSTQHSQHKAGLA